MLTLTSPAATPPVVDRLPQAILKTVLYADIFDYPLSLGELHHYLIGANATLAEVRSALASDGLRARLICRHGYYALRDRPGLVPERLRRRERSARLWRRVRAWSRWLGAVPFVRMVAVTGALAMDNAPADDDDVDVLLVTRPGRVWLARALSLVLVVAGRLTGLRLCPNYVLSSAALEQAPRDLYIAHELAQMVPLSGRDWYAALRAANAWTHAYLPQAGQPWRAEAELAPGGLARGLQRLGEWLLGGALGDALERWEQARKQRKFQPAARGAAAARLDADHVKGHFDDHGGPILAAYRRRVEQHLEARA